MKKDSFLKSGSYLLLAMVFSKTIAFILNVLCAKYLDKNSFGQLSFVRNTAAMFEGIVSGSNSNLVISSFGDKNYYSSVFLSYIVYSILSIVIITYLFYMSFGGFILVNDYIYVFLIFIFFSSCSLGMINSILIASNNNKTMVILSFFSGFISMVICPFLIYNNNYNGALLAYTLYFSIDFIFKLYWVLKNKINRNVYKFFFNTSILKRSYKLLVYTSVSLIFFWYIRSELVVTDNGLAELAEFELVYQFVTIALIAVGAFTSTMLSKIGREEKIIRKTILVGLFFSMTTYIFSFLFGEKIFSAINSSYDNINLLSPYVVFIVFPFTFNSIMNKVLIAYKIEYISVYSSLLSVIGCFLLYYFYFSMNAVTLSLLYSIYYFFVSLFSLFWFYLNKINSLNLQ
ncbi:hypothetical protein ABRQ07_07725 [Pectobacterium polonicum]|uniref:Wzx n=1 Tax=Pectobacterium polonicum TaxID=2485124 RepID=A0ABV1P8M8_9GAMM|nr:hypothetical protein [Pectobacterium polonicum]MDC9819006.1 hypothetical protein [Pectobacterium polonicum]